MTHDQNGQKQVNNAGLDAVTSEAHNNRRGGGQNALLRLCLMMIALC